MGCKKFLQDIFRRRQEEVDRMTADEEFRRQKLKEQKKKLQDSLDRQQQEKTLADQQSRQKRVVGIEIRLNEIDRKMAELDRVAEENPPIDLPGPTSRTVKGKRRQQAKKQTVLADTGNAFNKFLLPFGGRKAAVFGLGINVIVAIFCVALTKGLDFLGGNTGISMVVLIACMIGVEIIGYLAFMGTLLSLQSFFSDGGRFKRLLEGLILTGCGVGSISFFGVVILRLMQTGI